MVGQHDDGEKNHHDCVAWMKRKAHFDVHEQAAGEATFDDLSSWPSIGISCFWLGESQHAGLASLDLCYLVRERIATFACRAANAKMYPPTRVRRLGLGNPTKDHLIAGWSSCVVIDRPNTTFCVGYLLQPLRLAKRRRLYPAAQANEFRIPRVKGPEYSDCADTMDPRILCSYS